MTAQPNPIILPNPRLRPLYLLFATLSAIGFLASLTIHILACFQIPTSRNLLFALFIGTFVVVLASMLFTIPTTVRDLRKETTSRNLDVFLARFRTPVGILTVALLAYFISNSIYCIICRQPFPKGQVPFILLLREASGFLLFCYGTATFGFMRLARASRRPAQTPPPDNAPTPRQSNS